MKKEQKGSITVFLSLIFLLVLAVVMTTIESARVNTAKVYMERTLLTAMDSILAEYYGPLYQEYHIFALDAGFGSENINTEVMNAKLVDYMDYTFQPGKDLYLIKDIPLEYFNLYGIKTTKVDIAKVNTLMDYEGDIFINQAISYEKYKEVGDGIESFLKQLNIIKESEKAQTILTEKQKTEESILEMDEDLMDLFEQVDGITMNKNGVKVDNDGKIVIQDYFVKKICILPSLKENLRIQNEYVFSSLNSHYVNPLHIVTLASDNIRAIEKNSLLISQVRQTLSSLYSIDLDKIKDKKVVNDISNAISNAQKSLNEYIKREESLVNTLKGYVDYLNQLISGTLSSNKSAKKTIDKLIIKQKEVTLDIEKYEKVLNEHKEDLSDDFYQVLLEDLKNLWKYKSNSNAPVEGSDNYDFEGIKETLIHNETILEELKNKAIPSFRVSAGNLSEISIMLQSIRSGLTQYSHNKLVFDYSSLKKPNESDSFFNNFKSLVEDGIIGLVIDNQDLISKKEISKTSLPSLNSNINESSNPIDLTSTLHKLNIKDGINSLKDSFKGLQENYNFKETAIEAGNIVGEFLIFQEYLLEHFDNFNINNQEETLKSLNYELEYIIMGKSKDYDNLKAVITRIVLIRTVLNLITLMSDSKSSNEARLLAAGFVGFTGLAALVSIVKTIILTIWAFEESLIDVAALLQGKLVPLLKNSKELHLELSELLLVNKSYIKGKVDKLKTSTAMVVLSYSDYLKVFLYMEGKKKKSYRAMDLIQENLQIKYEDTFYIKNCLTGFRVSADFEVDAKFITLPFIDTSKEFNDSVYGYSVVNEYTY
jgi:hypothetical protein